MRIDIYRTGAKVTPAIRKMKVEFATSGRDCWRASDSTSISDRSVAAIRMLAVAGLLSCPKSIRSDSNADSLAFPHTDGASE